MKYILISKMLVSGERFIDSTNKFQIGRVIDGPAIFTQRYRRLALHVRHREFFRTQVGRDMLSFGRLLRLAPSPLQSSKRECLGVETVRIRVAKNIRDIVAVAHLKASDDLVDNRGIYERAIRSDSNHDARGMGLSRPVEAIENIGFAAAKVLDS